MIRLITRLEKSKACWAILWISVAFFLLRLPSLIEPNWYGDEGIYQVIGRAINSGSLLYTDIWDNKPPLLYLVYALFNGDQFGTRLASLFVGLFSTWSFFYLAQRLFEKVKISIISTSIFAFLFAIPFIEGNIANAENFMLFPIILSAILIFKLEKNKSNHKRYAIGYMLLAGLLLGIAFLFKIVAIFDLAAFLVFLIIVNFPINVLRGRLKVESEKLKTIFYDVFFILLGFLLPFTVTVFYFFTNNALEDFFRATFFGMFGYVSYGNSLIIPQGFLILKLSLLAAFIILLLVKKDKLSNAALFILLWTAFSLFNALFAQRPYTHYVLVMLPSFCMLIGLILHEKSLRARQAFILVLILITTSLLMTFKLYNFKRTLFYYQNAVLFISGKKDVRSYQEFFDRKTPRDYDLAAYIKMHLKPNERLFVWGDSAQIYTLSKTFPINKYTVSYHVGQSKNGYKETQIALDKVKPKYVIILPESRVFPFAMSSYVDKISISNAVVYERVF